jgi:hypothetical protein
MKKIILLILIVHCTLNIAPPFASRFFGKDCMCQWIPCGQITGMGTYSIDTIGSNLYCGTYQGGVFLSSNNGVNWINICNGQLPNLVFTITHNNSYLFAYVNQSGIYRTSNNGANWILLNTEFTPCKGLIANKDFVFSSGTNGVYHSSNNGDNWIKTPDTIFYNNPATLFSFVNPNLFAGTSNGIYLTSNYGQNWIKILNNQVWTIAVQGNKIYTNPYSVGVKVSTNLGSFWTQIAPYSQSVGVFGNNVFIAGRLDSLMSNNFFVSSNNGINWIDKSNGLSSTNGGQMNHIFVFNNYIYLCWANANLYQFNTLWRRPLSEIIGIKKISELYPSDYKLFQNYPNPFNPSTNIKFQIKDPRLVTLKVYNILGKEIATLVNEKQSPGVYEVTWDGSGFASGIYFYKLQADDFSEVKKMILIK